MQNSNSNFPWMEACSAFLLRFLICQSSFAQAPAVELDGAAQNHAAARRLELRKARYAELLNTLPGQSLRSAVHKVPTGHGYVHSLQSPSGHVLCPDGDRPLPGQSVPSRFLGQWGDLFCDQVAGLEFSLRHVNERAPITFSRYAQLYNKMPIIGAQITIQSEKGGVSAVMSDLLTDFNTLGNLAGTPENLLPPESIKFLALEWFSANFEGGPRSMLATSQPHLAIYAPELLGQPGSPTTAYTISLFKNQVDEGGSVQLVSLIIDAENGEVLRYSEGFAKSINRQVCQHFVNPKNDCRNEGEAPSAYSVINETYDWLGELYVYYYTNHARDGCDNQGGKIAVALNGAYNENTVCSSCWLCTNNRENLCYTAVYCGMCQTDPQDENSFVPCDYLIIMTKGLINDEILAHEYAHAVFCHEGLWLSYTCSVEQYAIRESLADMFSAWHSQAFQKDDMRGRWLVGEDIDWGPGKVALRDLQNPSRSDVYNPGPDRYGLRTRYNLLDPHVLAGIGNKLAFLLTDGETFNGQHVQGMGLVKASQLFFESTHLLNPTSGYKDLYLALMQAADNLHYTDSERRNIANACHAVEITTDVPPWIFIKTNSSFRLNSQFEFTLQSQTSGAVAIQASTDLVNWTYLTNLAFPSGDIPLLFDMATNYSMRFYRAVLYP